MQQHIIYHCLLTCGACVCSLAVAFMNYALPAHDSYKIGRLASRVGKSLRDMCEPRNPGLLTHRPERPIVCEYIISHVIMQ